MGEIEIETKEFWESEATEVLLNPALGEEARAEGETLRGKLNDEPEFRGHVVFRTSGTEGEGKYVCLAKRALLASAAGVNRHLAAAAGDRWLRALPLFHVGGFAIHARAHLAGGAVVESEGKWDAGKFARTCEDEGITLTSLVPTQVYDVVEGGHRGAESLRAVLVGGGALTEELGEAARDLGWPLLPTYGMTEAGSQVATARPGAPGAEGDRNEGLELLDIWEARQNEGGVLELRGEALFSAYAWLEEGRLMHDEAKTGGWFVTGDRVNLTTRAGVTRLRFEGREGETVKILGELVSLDRLRERLQRLADAAGVTPGAVALAAVPDERRGVRLVMAIVEGVGERECGEMMERMNAGVPGFERVEEVVRVGEIPGVEAGKADYGRLNRLILSGSCR